MGPAWRRNYVRYKRFFLTFFTKYKERQDLKMFLEILLSLATISLFSLLALRPTVITIAELIKEIEGKKETIAIMDEKISNLSTAQALYDQEINKIRLLDTSVPHSPSPETLMRQMEGLAAKQSVGILSMSSPAITLLGEEKNENEVEINETPLGSEGNVGFTIRASADYPLLLSYLENLDKMRRPILINSVSLGLSKTNEGTFLILVVNGNIPYLRNISKRTSQ